MDSSQNFRQKQNAEELLKSQFGQNYVNHFFVGQLFKLSEQYFVGHLFKLSEPY